MSEKAMGSGLSADNTTLYETRGLLRHGVEHLTERQQAKIAACLNAGDPHFRSISANPIHIAPTAQSRAAQYVNTASWPI
jgi:hypothetical protein